MLNNVYVVFDTKAKVYNKPFYLLNDDIAMRVAIAMRSDNPEVKRFPEDFIMFKLGTYDDLTAKFDLFDSPQVLYRLHELQVSADV